MPGQFCIQAELEQRAAKDEDAQDFHARYLSVSDYLRREYYDWVQATCPFFTDHGRKHIDSVVQSVSQLLSGNPGSLSPLDLFLLLSGIVWHDVGNAVSRSQHSEHIGHIAEEVKKLAFPGPDVQRLVVEISQAHSRTYGLATPRLEEDCVSRSGVTYQVRPRALAALVRLADEISENRFRISADLLPNVPDENRIFWEYANCISSCRADPLRERIVVQLAIPGERAVARYRCPPKLHERASADGTISLIEYIVCRLEKMNLERAYCSPEFTCYASVRSLEVRLSVLRNAERIPSCDGVVLIGFSGLGDNSYPSIPIFDDFFKKHPHLTPERLQEVISTWAAALTSPA